MALKIVVFALVIGICKVQSQSIGCLSNQQSSLSNNQQSCGCGQQSQTENEEECDFRLSADRERHALSISSETFTQRNERLASQRTRTSAARSQENEEERDLLLSADRNRHALSRSSETFTQRNERLASQQTRTSAARSQIQLQPSNSNRLKASPQLQIMPGQNCNLQAIPLSQLSQLFSQGSNLQRPQTGCGCATPRQSIQVSSVPKIPSPTVQCAQPTQPCACSPTVISAPVSTITIPPSNCPTIIDNSLCNSLANALQIKLANDFINSAVSNNIINQECSIPLVETSVTGFDLSNFLKTLNSNQLGCQTPTTSSCSSSEPSCSDWERLLERLRGDQCSTCGETPTTDWSAVLNYLNSQNDRCETVAIQPVCSNYDYSSFNDYLKQNGQTVSQISRQYPGQSCGQTQNYNLQQGVYMPSCQCDTNNVLEALAAYLGVSPSDICSNTYPNVPEVVFPEEIPAQLICNYGYMPTSVPVVNFSVQPIGDCSNFVVGTKC